MNIENRINHLLDGFIDHSCITIIGSEAILQPNEENNFTCDSMIRLLRKVALGKKRIDSKDINKCKYDTDFWNLLYSNDYSITAQDMENVWAEDPLNKGMQIPQGGFWADGLLNLLKWNRIIFTTAIDPLIEYAMREAYANTTEEPISINLRNDPDLNLLADHLKKYMENPYEVPPLLIFMFGRIDNTIDKFPFDENSYVHAITEVSLAILHKQNGCMLNYLSRQESLLMVGTQMDDWRFRFLWHTLMRINESNVLGIERMYFRDQEKCTVVFSQMSEHLQQTNSSNFCKGSTHDFLIELGESLCTDKMRKQALLKYNSTKNVFISYKHSNYRDAKQLYRMLKNKNYSVWLDESSLLPGDFYLEVIHEVLDKTQYMVLLLTNEVAEDLTNLIDKLDWKGDLDMQLEELYKKKETCFYILNEWRYAIKKGGITIIPVFTDGYYCNELYHTTVFNYLMNCNDDEYKMMSVGQINLNDGECVEQISRKINSKNR